MGLGFCVCCGQVWGPYDAFCGCDIDHCTTCALEVRLDNERRQHERLLEALRSPASVSAAQGGLGTDRWLEELRAAVEAPLVVP